MNEIQYRCVQCFRIVDVQESRDILLFDEGIRNGHYWARYNYTHLQPFCGKCRHRIAAFARLLGMRQRMGWDIEFTPKYHPPFEPNAR